METKKNRFEKAAEKSSLLGSITADLETKGDVKNSSIETVKDLIVGVLGGGVVGAALGKASLAVGAVVTGIGHYTKSRLASVFGLGMMASGGFSKPATPVSGLGEQDMLEGVKERVMAFKDGISEKLFLDKILKGKKELAPKKEESTAGVGEVQYFSYPNNKELEGDPAKELDMSALDHLEQQIASSGQNFAKRQRMEGLNEAVENEFGETSDPDMGDASDPEMNDVEPGENNF